MVFCSSVLGMAVEIYAHGCGNIVLIPVMWTYSSLCIRRQGTQLAIYCMLARILVHVSVCTCACKELVLFEGTCSTFIGSIICICVIHIAMYCVDL